MPSHHWQRPHDYDSQKSPPFYEGDSRDFIHESMDVELYRMLKLRVRQYPRGRTMPIHIFFHPSWSGDSSEVLNLCLYQDQATGIRGSLIRYEFGAGVPLSSTVVPGIVDLTKSVHLPDQMVTVEPRDKEKFKINRMTLYACVLGFIFLFGGIFSTKCSRDPTLMMSTAPNVTEKIQILDTLSPFDRTLTQHHNTPAYIDRLCGISPEKSLQTHKIPSINKYRGKVLPLFTDLASAASTLEPIANHLLLSKQLFAETPVYYDIVGFFENLATDYRRITLAAYGLEKTNQTLPPYKSPIESLVDRDFTGMVSQFLEKWFRILDTIQDYRNVQLIDLAALSSPYLPHSTGQEAFARLRQYFPPSSTPSRTELAFIDLGSWLTSLYDDINEIEATLRDMSTAVNDLQTNIGPSTLPGQTASRYLQAYNLKWQIDQLYGLSFVQTIKNHLGSARDLANREVTILGEIRSLIEGLDQHAGKIMAASPDGKCSAKFCLQTGESMDAELSEAVKVVERTTSHVREEWEIWKGKMLEAREKGFERF